MVYIPPKKRVTLTRKEGAMVAATAADYFGKLIPVSGGRRKVNGVYLWVGESTVRYDRDRGAVRSRKAFFAVGLGKPLAPDGTLIATRVTRIWMNGVIMYDMINPSGTTAMRGRFNFRVYPGTETQNPDPYIESVVGVDRTPAFRGMVYVMFQGLDLKPLGLDRLPETVEIEIEDIYDPRIYFTKFTRLAEPQPSIEEVQEQFTGYPELNVLLGVSGSADVDADVLHTFDMRTMREIRQLKPNKVFPEFLAYEGGPYACRNFNKFTFTESRGLVFFPDIDLVVATNSGASNSQPLVAMRYSDGRILGTFGEISNSLVNDATRQVFPTGMLPVTLVYPNARPSVWRWWIPTRHFILVRDVFGRLRAYAVGNPGEIRPYEGSANPPAEAPFYHIGDRYHRVALLPILKKSNFPGTGDQPSTIGQSTQGINLEFTQFRDWQIIEDVPWINPTADRAGSGVPGVRAATVAVADDNKLYAVVIYHTAFYGSEEHCRTVFIKELDPAYTWDKLYADPEDRCLVAVYSSNVETRVTKIDLYSLAGAIATDPNTSGYTVTTVYDKAIPEIDSISWSRMVKPIHSYARTFGYPSAGGFTVVDMITGEYEEFEHPNPAYNTEDGTTEDLNKSTWQIWDSTRFAYWRMNGDSGSGDDAVGPAKVNVGRGAEEALPMSDAIAWLARAAGYEDVQIEVTGLDNDFVTGVMVADRVTFKSLIDQISIIWNFMYYVSENKLKIVKKTIGETVTSDLTINGDEDFAGISGNDDIEVFRADRSASDTRPRMIDLTYFNVDAQYKEDTVSAKRTTFPVQTAVSVGSAAYKVPIIMTPRKAFNLIHNALYFAWSDQINYEFRLGQEYLCLEPSDILALTYGGNSYNVQVFEATLNADWSVSVAASEISANVSDENYDYDGGVVDDGQTIPGPVYAKAQAFNFPLVSSPSDVYGQQTMTWVGLMIADTDNFVSANIYQLSDEGRELIGTLTDVILAGYMSTTLAAPTDMVFIPYREDTITLTITSGDATILEDCVDEQEWFSGKNIIMVGIDGRWEVIYWNTHTYDATTKTVVLTGLIRGRAGSDVFVGDHESTDTVVFFNEALFPAPIDVSNLTENIVFQVASPDTDVNEYFIMMDEMVVEGRAEKQWAPVHIQITSGTVGSDIDVAFRPRARVYSPLHDDSADISEDTDTITFDAEILDAGDGSVLRSFTDLVDPEFTYTAAQQATDAQPYITVRVSAKSPVYGRGDYRTEILT